MLTRVTKPLVLICDDDEGIVDFTSILLGESGCDVLAAINGEEIFEVLNKSLPDLILLDLWLPLLSGEEVIDILKKKKRTQHIPVIIISASKDTEQVAQRAGADDFLCKPFDIQKLEKLVRTHLSKKGFTAISSNILTHK